MQNSLARKLGNLAALSPDDRTFLDDIVRDDRKVGANRDLIRKGDKPGCVHLVVKGLAYRYKLLENGKRQIVAYLLPGDMTDLHTCLLGQMDHSIATMSASNVVEIAPDRIPELMGRPAISRALQLSALVDAAVLREWLLNIGQRPAEQRIAHFLCEMLVRYRLVGLAHGDIYDLPITQTKLADTFGLSLVHLNRCFQNLKARGLITYKRKRLAILDADGLQQAGEFDSLYLRAR